MTVAFGAQAERGVPAEEMRVAIHGPLSARYVAEFHSHILDDLAEFDPDWVSTITPGGADNPAEPRSPAHETIRRLNFSDFGDKALLPDSEPFVKSFIYKSFNRDCVLTTAMSASFSITPLFASMVERRGIAPDRAGSEALDIVAPNVGVLPWEAVVEFREHSGSTEARARLREFEALAASQDPQDAYDFLKRVSREVNQAYLDAIHSLAPSLPENLAKEALLTLISVTSVIGPVLEKIGSVGNTITEMREFNRSWIAALMHLQR
jgi:hypothetical protein